MGWALKSSHVKRTRFTEKQRDYLSSKFRIGQTTGQKADAASVSKSMMAARDSNGQRLSTSVEFLTSQQVSSFFSRLSSQRKLGDGEMTDSDIQENQNAKNEEAPFASYGVKFFKRLPLLIQSAMTVMTSANLLQIQSYRTLQFKYFRKSASTLISDNGHQS